MGSDTVNILLFEDNPGDARLVQEALADAGAAAPFKLTWVTTLSKGLAHLSKKPVDAVLLDLSLPDSSGWDTFEKVRVGARQAPIILLTGMDDELLAEKAAQAGAQEYLVKGQVDSKLLVRSIRYAIERQQTKQELSENEQRLATLISNLPGFAYRCANDRSWTTHFISDGCKDMTGYAPDDFIQNRKLSYNDIIHPDYQELLWRKWQELLQRREAFEGEYPIITANGETRWVWERGRGIFSEAGELLFLEGFITDITTRKRTEQSILLLSDTQRQIAHIEDLLELFQLIGQKVEELVGDAFVSVSMLDEKIQGMKIVGMYGLGSLYENLVRKFKVDPSKSVYYLKDMTADELRLYRSGRLEKLEGGLYALLTRKVPKRICTAAEKELKLSGIYAMGFVHQDKHFGGLTILARSDLAPFIDMIETIVSQATISIKRIRAEEGLREINDFNQSLIQTIPFGIDIVDKHGNILYLDPNFEKVVGREALGKKCWQYYKDDRQQCADCPLRQPIRIGETRSIETAGVLGGKTYEISHTGLNFQGQPAILEVFYDITERKQVENALRASEARFSTVFQSSPMSIAVGRLSDGSLMEINRAWLAITGYTREEAIGATAAELNVWAIPDERKQVIATLNEQGTVHGLEVHLRNRTGEVHELLMSAEVIEVAGESCMLTMSVDITDRKQAEAALARQTEELVRLYRASGSLLTDSPFNFQASAQAILKTVLEEFGQTNCSIFLVEEGSGELDRIVTGGPFADRVTKVELTLVGPGQVPLAIRTGQAINTPDVRINPAYISGWDLARSELTIPLKIGTRVIGAIDVQSAHLAAFSADDARLMTIFSERAALALEHARLYSQTEHRLQDLTSLRSIDMAIASSFDLNFTLGILLGQATKRLGVDAADVLIFNPVTQAFRSSVVNGFRGKGPGLTNLRLIDSYAGQVVRERHMITVENLTADAGERQRAAELVMEGFTSYVGVPLVAKGLVKGVLEIYQRRPIVLDQEQRSFLDLLAGQAAIAIDSAQLFENLQSSNAELMMAYDETIEGWSQALDLRDRETEGHSLRVTEMTVRLAGSLGCNPEELTHIRRGSLLHDIGKLGVPDEILRKPGPLTDEEWVNMRKHPQFAYDMLAPITYLHTALDIPYCHHEKWDGTGYPRGLKEQQIPLAARIFAVVDVWDALTSDRPYRKAWSREEALVYIQDQAGKHFDPKLVSAFLVEISNKEWDH